jgi:hypothetical protein
VPALHAWHWLPLAPHAVVLVPGSQTVSLQHPAHVPHGDSATHCPSASHVSPAGQSQDDTTAQTPPPASGVAMHSAVGPNCVQSSHSEPAPPQDSSAVPSLHVPLMQHPLQLAGVHAPESEPASSPKSVVAPSKRDDRPHPATAKAESAMSAVNAARARRMSASARTRSSGDLHVALGARPFMTPLEA